MSPDAPPTPGPDGTPVPPGLRVIRMANEPKLASLSPEAARQAQAGKAIPSFFELSSEDRKQLVPRLSVWVEALTTVAQAWVLVGANPGRRWVVSLEADKVRAVLAKAVDKLPPTPPLDIQWERATVLTGTGDRVPDNRPGWEGHAGIANLDKGNKTQRDALRWQLTELATVRILTEDEIAAFGSPAAESTASDSIASPTQNPTP